MKRQVTRFFRAMALLLCVLASPGYAAPEVGAAAPALRGTLFSGKDLDLASMRGKVVLVNFYSSYCKHCAYEIGNIESFMEQHREQGFEVVAIGVDRPQDRDRVERMLGIYNLPGTMIQDLSENGFGKDYRTPTAFLIDRKGIVRSMHWGSKTPLYFRETVLPVLAEPR
jgi:thiol-disulfide isomerase/thioredoxin